MFRFAMGATQTCMELGISYSVLKCALNSMNIKPLNVTPSFISMNCRKHVFLVGITPCYHNFQPHIMEFGIKNKLTKNSNHPLVRIM